MGERHPRRTKTVVVLGASYGGISAVRTLVQELPKGWEIILVDRNRCAWNISNR
jgi:NADH dehydrogenase FAD-containing subunit